MSVIPTAALTLAFVCLLALGHLFLAVACLAGAYLAMPQEVSGSQIVFIIAVGIATGYLIRATA